MHAPAQPPFSIRPLTAQDELRRCVELQFETWGRDFTESVPRSILKISQRLGGVAAGAFDEDDRMLGFVFGLTGVENGRIVHWSDMLAVRSDARGMGVGTALKHWQREQAGAVGAEIVYWTYDPLVARNAHINIMKLEATIAEYVADMYGESDSDLHRGLGTDRFVVAWPVVEDAESLDHRRARRRHAHAMAPVAPTINGGGSFDGAEAVAVAVPADILAIQNRSLEEAASWRRTTRAAFQRALAEGYEVAAITTGGAESVARYILLRREEGAESR